MSAAAFVNVVFSWMGVKNGWLKRSKVGMVQRRTITRGRIQPFILDLIELETIGATPAPLEWSRYLSHGEIAAWCECTVRAVEIELKDMLARKVIVRHKTADGLGFSYRNACENWATCPPPSKLALVEAPVKPDESPDDDSEPRPATAPRHELGDMKLTTGRPSRRKKLPYEATQVQFETDLDGVIVRSELVDAIVITKVFARDCVQKANDSNAAYRKEIRVKNQEVESGQQKNSTKAQSANGKKPRPAATSPEEHQHSNFDQFQSAYLQHKINFAPKDWEAARSTWNILELSDQLAAVKGISDRFEQGEYDPRAPQWIPFPQNYLKDSLWKRTVRPGKKPAGKVKVYKDDTTAFAALDLARRMDQKIAGKR